MSILSPSLWFLLQPAGFGWAARRNKHMKHLMCPHFTLSCLFVKLCVNEQLHQINQTYLPVSSRFEVSANSLTFVQVSETLTVLMFVQVSETVYLNDRGKLFSNFSYLSPAQVPGHALKHPLQTGCMNDGLASRMIYLLLTDLPQLK